MAPLNSVRITVIGLVIVVALALGAWTRLTIAMASGAAASRVSASSPTTSALATTNVAPSKATKTDAGKSAKTDAKGTIVAKTTNQTKSTTSISHPPASTTKASTTKASTAKVASATPTASSAATSSSSAATSSSTATSDSSPQQIAQSMLASYGWGSGQWTYLYQLWEKESAWSVTATNPESGAYGIAQANPASQMDSAGSDWRTDAATQIKWGLEYIKDRYGSPAAAWAHETADGWY